MWILKIKTYGLLRGVVQLPLPQATKGGTYRWLGWHTLTHISFIPSTSQQIQLGMVKFTTLFIFFHPVIGLHMVLPDTSTYTIAGLPFLDFLLGNVPWVWGIPCKQAMPAVAHQRLGQVVIHAEDFLLIQVLLKTLQQGGLELPKLPTCWIFSNFCKKTVRADETCLLEICKTSIFTCTWRGCLSKISTLFGRWLHHYTADLRYLVTNLLQVSIFMYIPSFAARTHPTDTY